MRCPYCGRNSERSTYCTNCGRDLRIPPSQQPVAGRQPPQGYPTSAPRQQPPQQQPRPVPPPPKPPAPVPPAPFPPHTLEHLHALEAGALAYTILDTTTDKKRKKTTRITYPKSVAWQQVATLLKVFKETQEEPYETIVIQGYLPNDPGLYSFTNGQLVFDRNVRLGSQTLNRYQIETGNGFEVDSVRIVLSEE